MPNKILSIVLDTPVNPNNIKRQIEKKQQKQPVSKNNSRFSKEFSKASQAYASSQIKRTPSSDYKIVKLLEEGLSIKDLSKELYDISQEELKKIDGKRIFEQAKKNNFNPVFNENSNVKRYFEYTDKNGMNELLVYDYQEDELIKKITLKDNGNLVSSIVNYSGSSFEELDFRVNKKSEQPLYRYLIGKNTGFNAIIDKEYKYSVITPGQLRQFKKGVSINSDGSTLTKLVIDYSSDGKCKSAQENILTDETGKIIIADPKINFNTQDNFYVVNINKA